MGCFKINNTDGKIRTEEEERLKTKSSQLGEREQRELAQAGSNGDPALWSQNRQDLQSGRRQGGPSP